MAKLTFKIDGMCCSEEMAAIKKALSPLLKGKEDRLTFDLVGEKIIIEQQDDLPTEDEIIKAVNTTGMKATSWKTYVEQRQPSEPFWQQHGQAILTAVSALNLVAGFTVDSIENGIRTALISGENQQRKYPIEVLVLYAVAMASGILLVLPKALRSIWRLRPDMNLLMTIAVGGAAGINQWFEAATASSLFSASLLLESWNLNRARKSIRALVEIVPSTARVVEKRIVKTQSNERYIRHYVAGDGDCGYTSLGITRANALKQLLESLDGIKDILKPAIRECLLIDRFYDYLVLNEVIPKNTTHQEIIENIAKYATDKNILKWYLYYDVRDKHIDAGWAHPCVLQALAHIQKKEICMWQLNNRDILIPHRGNEFDYTIYLPTGAQERINLLFIYGNHFERLEFYGNEDIIENALPSISDSSMEQNITIEKIVEEVPVDSIILVRPGEKIPLDSILISGITDVNQAPITGESMPVHKEIGDELFAGTINGDAAILCRVTKAASDSTLARIIHMVEVAQSRRANSEQFVEKFATYYTPAMMVIAITLMVILMFVFGRPWKEALYQALEILVIACPCALVISTPISIVAGLNAAARSGVLIKGGVYLEAPAHIKAIALDKTGTLTSGEPTVQQLIAFNGQSEENLLKLALLLEEHSDHPLARAIRRKAALEGIIADKQVTDFRIFKGKGAEGYLEGKLFWIGSRRLLQEKVSDPLPGALIDKMQSLENSGYSVVVIGFNQQLCGLIAISDSVRAGCKDAIQALKQIGIKKIIMLTGDNEGSANAIARTVEIDDYQAGLLPEDKVKHIESLVEKYQQVAMVGDGVNDAPAMAAATLSIAMGAAGSDTAIETADIALMSDDLKKLPWLVNHSRRTLSIIKQNIAFSLVVKAVFMGLAFANKSTLGMAIAADMGASFIVVFNGLRLLNDRFSLGCCNTQRKTATDSIKYKDEKRPDERQPLLLAQPNNRDKFTLNALSGRGSFFNEQQVKAASKKPCCSSGSCSKSKEPPREPISALGSDQPIILAQDVGDGKMASSDGRSTFFKEQPAISVPKKPCCSGGSCSKSKEPSLVSTSNQPVVSAQIAPIETITSLAANADTVKEMATQLKPPSPPSPKT